MISTENDKTIHQILKEYWGYDDFRSSQFQIINSICNKKDTLAVLPTGAGKSICYQLPAIYMEGVCLVVSPLIALMNDQVESLNKKGIKAYALNSTQSYKRQDHILDNAIYGKVKLLYLSPEKLKSNLVLERLKRMKINLIAVDEAHCISQWGHDFRPAYRNIALLRNIIEAPMIAVTATATKKVVEDILVNLKLINPFIEILSPRRKNLSYNVPFAEHRVLAAAERMKGNNDCAIMYVRNRRSTKELGDYFQKRKIKTSSFHGGMRKEEKEKAQSEWLTNKTQLMIATSAFGMGVDKKDVRSVFHIAAPQSLEEYVQEAGRAGRDGALAHAIFYFDNNTFESSRKMIEKSFPKIEYIARVYQALCISQNLAEGSEMESFARLDLSKISSKLSLAYSVIYAACKLLELAELLELSDQFNNPAKLLLYQDQIVDYVRTQDSNNPLSIIIKSFLRQHEGLFFDPVKINLSAIVKSLSMDEKTIDQYLNKINSLGLGEYQRPFNDAAFRISYPRINSHNLELSPAIYENRKRLALRQLADIEGYANTQDCRQVFIDRYFDSDNDQACGICDNCLRNKKLNINSKTIQESIPEEGILLKDLLQNFTEVQRRESQDIIAKLIDENYLELRSMRLYRK